MQRFGLASLRLGIADFELIKFLGQVLNLGWPYITNVKNEHCGFATHFDHYSWNSKLFRVKLIGVRHSDTQTVRHGRESDFVLRAFDWLLLVGRTSGILNENDKSST